MKNVLHQFCKILQMLAESYQKSAKSPWLSIHLEVHQSPVTRWQLHMSHRLHLPRYRCSLAGCALMNWTRTHVSCCWHICVTLGHAFICAALRVPELLIKTFIIFWFQIRFYAQEKLPCIHPFSSAYPGSGRGGGSLCREAQTSVSPATSSRKTCNKKIKTFLSS